MLSKVTKRFLNYQYYGFASTHASDEAYLQEVRKRYVTPDMEKWAYLEYKKHPSATLSHYDPKSKDYVESERDEYNAQVSTDSHNSLIDQFKKNLQTQRKVHDILQKMDRPYLRGVPGVTKNISAGLQDYTNPVDLKSNVDHNDFYRDAYKNENRWIDQNNPQIHSPFHYSLCKYTICHLNILLNFKQIKIFSKKQKQNKKLINCNKIYLILIYLSLFRYSLYAN